jgi:hypothetical protein
VSVTLGLPFVLVIRRYTATERSGKSFGQVMHDLDI